MSHRGIKEKGDEQCELSCSCDKPEPMSVDEAILLVLTGLGTERRQVAEVIRSLDERARVAEEQVERLIATRGR